MSDDNNDLEKTEEDASSEEEKQKDADESVIPDEVFEAIP